MGSYFAESLTFFMPVRFRFSPSAFLAVLLSTLGAASVAQPTLVLVPNDEVASEDTRVPAIDLAVVRFAGMASGSYYWPEGLLAEQLIAGLSSPVERQQQALPGGRQLLSSYRLSYGGSERAAVLIDSRSGNVLAAALVHRACGKGSAASGCLDDQHAVLSIFLRPGFDLAGAQPLRAWSLKTPERLQFGQGEKFGKIEYVTLDARHTAAPPVERPTGFSAEVPLYPKAVIHRTGQDALSDAKAQRVLRLQTTDSVEQVMAFYKQLSPPLQDMESGDDYVTGRRQGIAFSVNAEHEQGMPAITKIELEIAE